MTEQQAEDETMPPDQPNGADREVGDSKQVDESAQPAEQDGVKRKRIVAAAIALILLIALAAVAWFALGGSDDGFFDLNAKTGQAPYKSQEEMQAELDRVVEEGMFNISIASVIQFDDGASPGTAYIENVPGNRYLMQVVIALDDTGETVYESKALKPDSYIESIQLTQDLEPGNHAATATFKALDPETREEAGQAAAKVTLAVAG